jgi:hypothetical protein
MEAGEQGREQRMAAQTAGVNGAREEDLPGVQN